MKATFAIVTLWAISLFYVSLIYVHAFFDPAINFNQHGLTVSAATDDPERQLVGLIVIVLISYTVAMIFFENGLEVVSPVVNVFLVLFLTCLFATILVRLSWWSEGHYVAATFVFLSVIGLVLGLAPHSEPRWLSFALASFVSVIFFPSLVFRMESASYSIRWMRLIAATELFCIFAVSVQLFLFFNTNT